MPAPLVHIGYQKTASTFLQKQIFADESVFVQPWGRQAAPAIEHFHLVHPGLFDPEHVRAELGTHGDKIPVMSQEDLSGYPIHGRYYAEIVASRVARAFPDARVLICVRAQPSMLVSQYFQYVRQGGPRSLRSLLEDNADRVGFRPIIRKEHFEYDLMYRVWRQHFEADQILMLPYELLRQQPQVYFDKLNGLLGTSLEPAAAQNVVHAKRGAAAMRLELIFNKILPKPASLPPRYEDYPLYLRMRNRTVRVFDGLASKYTRIGSSFEDSLYNVVRDVLGDHYAASNARLAALLDLDLTALGYTCGPAADDGQTPSKAPQ